EVGAAFPGGAGRARSGLGPALIELVTMRMGGHAHHDDMLYLGKETAPSWNYPSLSPGAYAARDAYPGGRTKDPIAPYAARLEAEQVIDHDVLEGFKKDAGELVNTEARAVIDSPWPTVEDAGAGCFADDVPRVRVEPLDPSTRLEVNLDPGL